MAGEAGEVLEWEARLVSKNLELAEAEARTLRAEQERRESVAEATKLEEALATATRDSRDIIEHLERTLKDANARREELATSLEVVTAKEDEQRQRAAKLEAELERQKDKLHEALKAEREAHKLFTRVAQLEEQLRERESAANEQLMLRRLEEKKREKAEDDAIALRRELSKAVHESRVFGFPWTVRLIRSTLQFHSTIAGQERDAFISSRTMHAFTTLTPGDSCLLFGGEPHALSADPDISHGATLKLEIGRGTVQPAWHLLNKPQEKRIMRRASMSLAGPALDFGTDAEVEVSTVLPGEGPDDAEPAARIGVATCHHRKRVYAFGGRLPDGSLTNELWSVNAETGGWELHPVCRDATKQPIEDVPPPAEGCAICSIPGVIQEMDMLLLLGGSTVPLLPAWEVGKPPPKDRKAVLQGVASHEAEQLGDLLTGGYLYIIATNTWKSLPRSVLDWQNAGNRPNPGRAYASLRVSPDRRLAYAFGGFDLFTGRPCRDLFALTLVDLPERARPWRAPSHVAGEPPPHRGFHDALFAGKHLVIAGGMGMGGKRLTDAYVLDCMDLTWERFHALDADSRVASLGAAGADMAADDAASTASASAHGDASVHGEPTVPGRIMALMPSGHLSGLEAFRSVELITDESGHFAELVVRDVHIPPAALVASSANANGVLTAQAYQESSEDAKSIKVDWGIRTSHAVVAYRVFMGVLGAPNVREMYKSSSGDESCCRVTGVKPGVRYQLRVKAELGTEELESGGVSVWSELLIVETAWGGGSSGRTPPRRSASAEPPEPDSRAKLPPRAPSSLARGFSALDAEAVQSGRGRLAPLTSIAPRRAAPSPGDAAGRERRWDHLTPPAKALDGKAGASVRRRLAA